MFLNRTFSISPFISIAGTVLVILLLLIGASEFTFFHTSYYGVSFEDALFSLCLATVAWLFGLMALASRKLHTNRVRLVLFLLRLCFYLIIFFISPHPWIFFPFILFLELEFHFSTGVIVFDMVMFLILTVYFVEMISMMLEGVRQTEEIGTSMILLLILYKPFKILTTYMFFQFQMRKYGWRFTGKDKLLAFAFSLIGSNKVSFQKEELQVTLISQYSKSDLELYRNILSSRELQRSKYLINH